ncbi:MAG: Uma2 family endonuclease [Planctomycetes bacterium]|nr:Uma2 family endonuclease [Planctomycetota bacterium]
MITAVGVRLKGHSERGRAETGRLDGRVLTGPEDTLCVLEVADSSLGYDRTRKLEVYARAGTPQYVIVNLVDNRLEIFEEPVPAEGRYGRTLSLEPEASLSLHVGAGNHLELSVRAILP